MSSQPASTSINQPRIVYKVSFKVIVWLYSIIPVCLILQWLDTSLWNGYLSHSLPSSPSHFILFQILFGTPHILASALLMTTNRDYFRHFRKKVFFMSIALAIVLGIGNLILPYHLLYIMVASWTVYHVLKQQHGIARGVCRLPEFNFNGLLWSSVTAGILIYIGIFLNLSLSEQQALWVLRISAVLCTVLLLFSIASHSKIETRFGQLFMWSNSFLVFTSFYLYSQQYYFLAILVPRIVHDTTAYLFYVTHDYNKHHQSPKNLLYRSAKHLNIPLVAVLPVLSFLLAFFLQAYGNEIFRVITGVLFGYEIYNFATLIIIGYFALMHYYTESFTWKKDSPYRNYIGFRF